MARESNSNDWEEMSTQNTQKFYTNEISIAAYLMGAKDIKLIKAEKDENDRFKIILDIQPEDAEAVLYDFPTSESIKFDRCVKFLKGILCPKTRRRR